MDEFYLLIFFPQFLLVSLFRLHSEVDEVKQNSNLSHKQNASYYYETFEKPENFFTHVSGVIGEKSLKG